MVSVGSKGAVLGYATLDKKRIKDTREILMMLQRWYMYVSTCNLETRQDNSQEGHIVQQTAKLWVKNDPGTLC